MKLLWNGQFLNYNPLIISILILDLDLSKMPNNAAWISPHFTNERSLLLSKTWISLVTCIHNTLYKIWVFFFFNTSYPFLKTADFLHPKFGSLQDLYKMVDESFRFDGLFSFHD